MKFRVINKNEWFPEDGKDQVYLKVDHWDDYSFVTMFQVIAFDKGGSRYDLGSVKIGFVGQVTGQPTYSTLASGFEELQETYFSVGQDVSYYEELTKIPLPGFKEEFLGALRDVAFDKAIREIAAGQEVFRVSLLRSVSLSAIEGQFARVIAGGVLLTDFNFSFIRPQSTTVAGVELSFVVTADSTPSTNIHALIGRNGVGKTTLLNEMTIAIVKSPSTASRFYQNSMFQKVEIEPTYFSSVISVSFSAFDPFHPPQEQPDPEQGTKYYYVGLKDLEDDTGILLKSLKTLREDCVASIGECFSDKGKLARWLAAIRTLESDDNFAQMKLADLAALPTEVVSDAADKLVNRMSSGHAVVLLTMSRLVAKVEEKTLVLLDEPESHLHPPLLSAFTRALSELLHSRNGVAIVATHSPVVLQEVPKSCAWVINRSRLSMHAQNPEVETFGENVGTLTREVFGLEVARSGFHSLLEAEVAQGKTYEGILAEYGGQLGLEARGILRGMVAERDIPRLQA